MREQRALAASEGRRVIGLAAGQPPPWRGLQIDADAVIAPGPPAIGAERGHALDELRDVADIALSHNDHGEVDAGAYLAELLLRRSPRLARAIEARVYSPLDGDHAELTRALNQLIKNNFEKGRVAAALPVHRNTLRDRIARISKLTGVDLETAGGRGLAWLAWLVRVAS